MHLMRTDAYYNYAIRKLVVCTFRLKSLNIQHKIILCISDQNVYLIFNQLRHFIVHFFFFFLIYIYILLRQTLIYISAHNLCI